MDINKWRADFFYPQFLNEVANEFLRSLILLGIDISGVSFKHVAPARQMVDPVRETPAKVLAIRSGLESLEEAIMEAGKDADELLRQKQTDNKKIDVLGLILDSDPRKVNASGKIQLESLLLDETDDNNQPQAVQ